MTVAYRDISLADVAGDSGLFVDGDWIETKDQDPNGDVRLIQLADIGVGEYLNRSARFLTSEKAAELKCTFLQPGDVLIARMPDPLGRACIFPGDSKPSVTAVDVCIVRPEPSDVDAAWLKWAINSARFRAELDRFATGTTRKRISRKNLGKIPLQLPPLPEQQRIAAILDKADAACRKRQVTLDLADQFLRSAFLDLFGDPVTNPKRWPTERVEKCAAEVVDCPHSTPRWTEEGVKCIRTSNLGHGNWVWDDTRYVTEQEYVERSSRGEAVAGDVILSREGTVGIAAIVPPDTRLCMGQRLVRVRPGNRLESEFLLAVLLWLLSPHLIARVMIGSTSKHLNVKEFRRMKIPVPPIEAQKHYTQLANSLRTLALRYSDAAEAEKVLGAALTQCAFRGELK